MLGTVLKYSLAAVVGAAVMAVGMHYGDDQTLARVKEELNIVRDSSRRDGKDETEELNKYIAANRPGWIANITLAMNVAELDRILAAAVKV